MRRASNFSGDQNILKGGVCVEEYLGSEANVLFRSFLALTAYISIASLEFQVRYFLFAVK
jgi:hypothetical protein